VILGAGEGPAFSVAAHSIYKWFPDEKRTLPTAILSQGSAFGVILAVPALNWVIVNYSWHYAVRRAWRRRPDVGGGVADPGQGGPLVHTPRWRLASRAFPISSF
jgi:hypothetical protein